MEGGNDKDGSQVGDEVNIVISLIVVGELSIG